MDCPFRISYAFSFSRAFLTVSKGKSLRICFFLIKVSMVCLGQNVSSCWRGFDLSPILSQVSISEQRMFVDEEGKEMPENYTNEIYFWCWVKTEHLSSIIEQMKLMNCKMFVSKLARGWSSYAFLIDSFHILGLASI